MEIILTLGGIIGLFILAIGATTSKGTTPDSLSQCADYVTSKRMFTAMIIASALPHSVALALIGGNEWSSLLALIYFIGMGFVAASPHYKRHDKTLHFFGAYLAALALVAVCSIAQPCSLAVYAIYIPFLIKKHRCNTLIAEALCGLQLLLTSILITF